MVVVSLGWGQLSRAFDGPTMLCRNHATPKSPDNATPANAVAMSVRFAPIRRSAASASPSPAPAAAPGSDDGLRKAVQRSDRLPWRRLLPFELPRIGGLESFKPGLLTQVAASAEGTPAPVMRTAPTSSRFSNSHRPELIPAIGRGRHRSHRWT